MNTDRIFNLEAEKELLGSILNNNNVLLEVINILESIDFSNDKHKLIYETMVKMYQESKGIDITTLYEALNKKAAKVGGITYLSELSSSVATTRNAKGYAEIIKEKSNMRLLQSSLRIQLKEAEDGELNTTDIISGLQNDLLKIKDNKQSDSGELGKPIIDFMDKLQKRFQNGGDIQGIRTHLTGLDKLLNGLNKEDFIIVCARPSMGKSAFSNNVAENVAYKSKGKVSMFSLEMSRDSLLDRMVASIAKVQLDNIKSGKLEDSEWESVARIIPLFTRSELRIYDKIFSLNGIIAECKKRKIQEGLNVVIIDYLQLITTNGKFQSREQEVSHISRQLKLLAKELGCAVIALSQLSRAPEQRADHRPMLSDLRESGSIEQDADIVIGLYRDEYYNPETEDKNIVESIVLKNRNGELGTIKLAWVPQYQLVGNAEQGMQYVGKYDKNKFRR